MSYAQRVQDARRIDALILQLNRESKLCFHVVEVLQDKQAYTDAFLYESKYHYTQALRLVKNADGTLRQAVCVNFKPGVRFEQPSLAQAVGDMAVAIVTPELAAAQNARANARVGELLLEPVPIETDFALEPVREVVRRYVPAREAFDQNSAMFGKLFNKFF